MPIAVSDRDIPPTMRAAVYKGNSVVEVEEVPVPSIGPGEILVRVEACGICNTDLKKIAHNLLPPPRIFGHETAGVVARVGENVQKFRPGDRVVVFHHIPCMNCFYCCRRLYAQCPTYKRVGAGAGFEPAGGGFAQYVRVMDWIVERGVEKIPGGVSFERASFVEPINTCLKAVVQCAPAAGDLVLVMGQGPIGLMFTMLLRRTGATVAVTDTIGARLELARRCGAQYAWDPAASAPGIVEKAIRYSRPGARLLLFAQTSDTERIEASGAAICVGERTLFGCYSASVDLQKQSADLVFNGELPIEDLISHRLPLDEIRTGIDWALHPGPKSLKIIVQPQRWSQ